MKKFIIFTILLACFGCQQKDSEQPKSERKYNIIEYYSTLPLRESPYADFRGVVRLTKEEVRERNHYEFAYDQDFRLLRVSFKLGDTLVNPNHTANYFFTSPQQRFTYEDNKEIRTFFDRFGNQVEQRNAYKEIYLKDDLGRYTSLYFEDEAGNRIENSWGIYEYTWKLENDGSVIENRVDQEGNPVSLRPGFEFYKIRLCYNQNGLLALMQNVDDEGSLVENNSGVAQDKLHFDKLGRWYGWTVLDAQHNVKRGNGPNVAKGINSTDQFGYERSIRYEDVDGTPIQNSYGFWGSKRFYDKRGNYAYTQFLDKDGNPGINENAGYSIAKYTWNASGKNRTRVDLLGLDNEPVLHKTRGYASIKQEYNGDGNLIKTSYLGLKGELVNRTDNGTAYITYFYDENKKLINRKRFDKDDTEID
ncbi:hypothetical protein [Flagellimonas nanhaiensis]|uniref:Uncharacterized protein n=1 Tax=Flagellimonas nanhaiensis TaxID=2292706 RepID=A0A371JPF8_9FLAO|nr:hypothetical protein [Allomuricauda nanhaiensis]RDY59400.1 hypothetical protein DX873_08415 [Allomuricauda nanhaiensis]